MNTMDNDKMIQVIEKFTLHKYLHNLSKADLRKITLFTPFPHTGAANISDPVNFIMVADLLKIIDLNSGKFFN